MQKGVQTLTQKILKEDPARLLAQCTSALPSETTAFREGVLGAGGSAELYLLAGRPLGEHFAGVEGIDLVQVATEADAALQANVKQLFGTLAQVLKQTGL